MNIFIVLVLAVGSYFLYKKRGLFLSKWAGIIDRDITLEQKELKEIMRMTRKQAAWHCEYERRCVAKTFAFLRDISYENFTLFGQEKYLNSFQMRVSELLTFLEVNTITNLPNREHEVLRITDMIYKETGLSIIRTKDNEYVNKFKLANGFVSMYFPDPNVNRILGFHRPQKKDSSLIDLQYIKENFLPSKSDFSIGDLCR